VSQCVFKFWQLMTGEFYPYNKRKFGRLFQNGMHLEELCNTIRHQKYKAICFNDAEKIDYETAKKSLNDAFESVLPEKSSFEK
ncbi:MAG: capsular biosynthesis protein, partial [Blautia sp.]